MHQLIIEDDEGTRVVYRLLRDEISLGRDEGNTIRLSERHVSRYHARLTLQNGRYFLEDLASQLGTSVNGDRIHAPTALDDGDRVVIGEYRLAYVDRPTTALGHPVVTAPPLVTSFVEKTPAPELGLVAVNRRQVSPSARTPPPLPERRGVGTTGTLVAVAATVAVTALVTLWLTDDGRNHRPVVVVPSSSGAGPEAETASSLLAAARRAEREEHWSDVANLAGRALALDPTLTEAEDLRATSDLEQQNGAIYQVMRRDSERGDLAHLLDLAPTVRLPSAYADRIRALTDGARAKLVQRHLTAAERDRASGDCASARRQAQLVLSLDGANSSARTLVARCEHAVTRSAMAAAPRVDAPGEPAPSSDQPAEAATPPGGAREVDVVDPYGKTAP
jgi:hypothetical protein